MKNTKTIKFKEADGSWGEPHVINLNEEPLMKVANAIKNKVTPDSTVENIQDLFLSNILSVLFGEHVANEYIGEEFLVVEEDRELGGTISLIYDVLDVNGAWDKALAHVIKYVNRYNESKRSNRKFQRSKVNEGMITSLAQFRKTLK